MDDEIDTTTVLRFLGLGFQGSGFRVGFRLRACVALRLGFSGGNPVPPFKLSQNSCCIYIRLCARMLHICIHESMCPCILCLCKYVHLCVSIFPHIYIYVCTYLCLFIYWRSYMLQELNPPK